MFGKFIILLKQNRVGLLLPKESELCLQRALDRASAVQRHGSVITDDFLGEFAGI